MREVERGLFGVSVIGSTTIAGSPVSQILTADGSRAVVTTADYNVAVIDTRTESQVGNTLTLAGAGQSPQTTLTPDGSRAVVTAPGADNTTTGVAVVDTVAGKQVGQTLTLSGTPLATVSSADGSRAVVTTGIYDSVTYGYSTTGVSVIDTATGRQVGDTLTLARFGSVSLSGDGSRAVVTNTGDGVSYGYPPTDVLVIDTATGEQVGNSLHFAGDGFCSLTPDGSRAVVTTAVYDPANHTHSAPQVAVIDLASGEQVGDTVTFGNSSPTASGSTLFSADGSRAVIAAGGSVAVVDTGSGAQVGNGLTLAAPGTEALSSTVLNAGGSRAIVTSRVQDSTSNDPWTSQISWSSKVAVIDTATGNQVGTTVAVPGSGSPGLGSTLLSADGSRAVVVVGNYEGGVGGAGYVEPVVVVDTTTGQQVGTTFTVPGDARLAALNADGSRAVVVTHSHAAVIDTATARQVGDTLTGNNLTALVSADGSRAVVTANQHGFVGVTSWVAVLDMTTGRQVGSTVDLPSDSTNFSTVLNANGSRAVITAYNIESSHRSDTMRVAVIDTATGQQVGSTLGIAGRRVPQIDAYGSDLVLSPDGTRALIRSVPATPVLDAVAGLLAISAFIPPLWPIAITTSLVVNFCTSFLSSEQWTMIDTATGTRIGNPHSVVGLDGSAIDYAPPVFTADGTRAMVLATTKWGLSNLARPSTLVATLPTA